MNIGWVSIDGTLDYNTTGYLGTSQCTRLPLIYDFLTKKYKIHWFGVKKNSHLINGHRDSNIKSYYDSWSELRSIFTKYWDNGKRLDDSRIKYTFTRTVSHALDKIKLPSLDVLFVQFQDINPAAICWELFLILYYIKANVPVLIFDTDLELRYKPAFVSKPSGSAMYITPIQRWLRDDYKYFRDVHLLYVCDVGSDMFYKHLHKFYPIYDVQRELAVVPSIKRWDISYVGNDKTKINRRPVFSEYLGNLGEFSAMVFGKWEDTQFNNLFPNVQFGGRIPEEWMMQVIGMGLCSPYFTNKFRGGISFMADRAVEVCQAGSVNITPNMMNDADCFTLSDYIVDSPEEFATKLRALRRSLAKGKYGDLIVAQRQLISESWGLTNALKDLSVISGLDL